jgi:hypothetical protein
VIAERPSFEVANFGADRHICSVIVAPFVPPAQGSPRIDHHRAVNIHLGGDLQAP